jgi:hypothetical protein
MHDPLNTIRRLYPEGLDAADNGAPPSPETAAEARALAPVRDALAARPRSRPDPAALDAVVAAAVAAHPEAQLAAVRALYEEGPTESLAPEAAAEARALAPVRDALAARPRQRPDAAVLEATVAAALAAGSAPTLPAAPRRAADRPGKRDRVRRGPWVGALLALIAVGAFLLWPERASAPETGAVVAEAPAPEIPAREEAAPLADSPEAPAPEPIAAAVPSPSAAAGAASAPTGRPPAARSAQGNVPSGANAVPPAAARVSAPATLPGPRPAIALARGAELPPVAPDVAFAATEADAEALRLMYLRLAALEATGTEWDEPAIVLGAAPGLSAPPAPARGWVQVRSNR